MKNLLLLLLLVGTTTGLLAQEDSPLPQGHYLTLGVGIAINTVRDQAHSPLRYRGSGLRFSLTHEHFRPKNVWRFQFALETGGFKAKLKPKRDINSEADLTDIQMHFGYYFRLGDAQLGGDGQQYAGIGLQVQANSREYPLPANNITGLLGHLSLTAEAMDRRAIDNNYLTTRAAMPFISAYLRPNYIGLPDLLHVQNVKTKDVIGVMELGSINRLFKLDISADYDRRASDWRSDRIGYNWSILHTPMPQYKPLTAVSGSLSYGYRVLL